jgi:hypothetical protein
LVVSLRGLLVPLTSIVLGSKLLLLPLLLNRRLADVHILLLESRFVRVIVASVLLLLSGRLVELALEALGSVLLHPVLGSSFFLGTDLVDLLAVSSKNVEVALPPRRRMHLDTRVPSVDVLLRPHNPLLAPKLVYLRFGLEPFEAITVRLLSGVELLVLLLGSPVVAVVGVLLVGGLVRVLGVLLGVVVLLGYRLGLVSPAEGPLGGASGGVGYFGAGVAVLLIFHLNFIDIINNLIQLK